jgi:endonuclease/exonuclease/phosphatase family metal-dependent hydrolase
LLFLVSPWQLINEKQRLFSLLYETLQKFFQGFSIFDLNLIFSIMKLFKFLFIIVFSLMIFSSCSQPKEPAKLKVISFNIRFDNPEDAPNNWPNRVPLVESYLKSEMPDVMGLQEALYHQNEEILNIMQGYAYIGTGRDDGKQGGEFSSVFYNTQSIEVLEDGQFWLSETPDVAGSIGWEAVLPRVVSWAHFKHLQSGLTFYFFNTHYSHVSDLAREKSMEFMSEKIMEIAGDEPVVVTGDFNIAQGSDLYNYMESHLKEQNKLQNAALVAQNIDSPADYTSNGFRDEAGQRVIDFIFVNDHFDVASYGVDQYKKDSLFISDHWPVRAHLLLK